MRRPVAMAMLGVGLSKLLELEGSGQIDSVLSGGSRGGTRLITTESIYRLLVRDSVLSHPYGASPLKALAPRTAFRTHDRVDGRSLRRTRTLAEMEALKRGNEKRRLEAQARRQQSAT